jgi:hypothetical protein
MLNTLLQKLINLGRKRAVVDPAQFGDPVAEKTVWTPAKRGGANFCTRRFKMIEQYRVVFRPTIGAVAFFLIFAIIGMAVSVGFTLLRAVRDNASIGPEMIIPGVVGLVFAAIGIGGIIKSISPIVFDRTNGYFWKGRKNPTEEFDLTTRKACVQLGRIHALQIISEYCRGNKNSYYSYELNLVLDDAERINVVDHGNLNKLRDDAQALAEFLGVPVWDAV